MSTPAIRRTISEQRHSEVPTTRRSIMRVLIAGATGVVGRQLVPLAVEDGYHVTVLARPPAAPLPWDVAAVHAEAFDARAIRSAVRRARPDVIVDLRTAIPARLAPRRFEQQMALTNRLRSEATAILVEASPGTSRFISQGLAFAYRPGATTPAEEDDELWTDGPRPFRPTVRALLDLESHTAAIDGLALRFGHLYGPGTAFAADGAVIQQLASRAMPIVGGGDAVFSFTHTADAASAIIAALHHPVVGRLNIVDDEPAPLNVWLPELARVIEAPQPRHIPVALARLAAGSWGVAYMNRLRGASNRRAHLTLDWRPGHPSWRTGLERELGRDHSSLAA
jgi:nucleoside-diphosphate-sugar epimerase